MKTVVLIQYAFHILGVINIVLGVIALLFGNTTRGWDMILGGVVFIVIKYLIGFVIVVYFNNKFKKTFKDVNLKKDETFTNEDKPTLQ